MIITIIIACEILFWVFLASGLAARYVLRAERLSTVLLICTPLVDLILLTASVIDIRGGATPTFAHALAAIYLGFSVGFGHRMIKWADERFAHRFAGGPAPQPAPKTVPAKAAHERHMLLLHLVAWAVACGLMGLAILALPAGTDVEAFTSTIRLLTVILAIDALWSLSYSVRASAA